MPDLFKGGTLDMSTSPLEAAAGTPLWGDCIVNHVAVVVTLVLIIIELTDIIRLYPSLLRCLQRWKGNLELEHSVSLARTRNTVALVAAMAFCLIADRWELVAPSFKMSLPQVWQLPVTAGLLAGAALLRRLLFFATKYRSKTSEFASAFRHIVFNYLILMVSVLLVAVLVLVPLKVPQTTVSSIMYAIVGMFILLHLVRTGQFLSSRCGTLATILYLCALEILPLGILIFVCTL